MRDERQGLPSASETERLALCRASFLRSKNQPDTSSGIAQTGTRIHEAVESGDDADCVCRARFNSTSVPGEGAWDSRMLAESKATPS